MVNKTIIIHPISECVNSSIVPVFVLSQPPTVAVFSHWVAGIQRSYSPLTNTSKSRRMAGLHSFLSGLNVHLYNDRELSRRPVWELSWDGDSTLQAQPFYPITGTVMGCEAALAARLVSQVGTELSVLPSRPTPAETAAGNPHLLSPH